MSQKELTLAIGLALIAMIALSGTGSAIRNGMPDLENHWSYVCWVVTYPGSGPYVWLGTGSLIAPNVVLTAGHVADVGDPSEGAWAQVSFDVNPTWTHLGPGWIAVDSWYTHPDYRLGGGSKGLTDWITHDVGILILEDPVEDVGYAQLPTAGLVDTLPMMQDVDLAGYGVQYQIRGLGIPPSDNWDWNDWPPYRYYAPAQIITANFEWSDMFVMLTANPGQGKGGTCFGDSGSPILLADTNIVLGVCSWGTNGNCAGTDYDQRVDIPEILNWINGFL